MKFNKKGKLIKRNNITLDNYPMFIHDCCLAGKYLVFFNFPFTLKLFPYILRIKPLLDLLEWDPNKQVEIVIVDKDSLELVTKVKTDNFFSFHFSNGYTDKNGNIIIDYVEYNSVDVLYKFARNVLTGDLNQNNFNAKLMRLTIDPLNSKLISKDVIYDKNCEFPTVMINHTGKKYDSCFISYSSKSNEFLSKIANLNVNKQVSVERDFGENKWVGESIHIPSDYNCSGYLLNVVYNAKIDKSEVHLMNSSNLEDEAVIEIPHGIPFGFHGVWQNII